MLEVIVSMAIISIISASVYTGYAIMIKQTKSGQVKQETALEGKNVIEALQGNSFSVPNATLTVDGMNFNKNGTEFVRYLNNKFKAKEENGDEVTEDTAQYTEKITLTPTKVTNSNNSSINNLKLGNDNPNEGENKLYISKNDSGEYIIKYSENDDEEEIPVVNNSDTGKKEMELSVYLTELENEEDTEKIEVLDYKGDNLVDFTKETNDNLIINFDNYKETDDTLPNDTVIKIYIYNKTSTAANLYVEKQKALVVDLEISKGEVNLYNNSADTVYGTLYDIKVEISDKNEGTLFTGYYKKNIHQ